jgi:hypothetical protein
MKKPVARGGIPNVVVAHYKLLMEGTRREQNGAVIREGGREGFTKHDLDTMDRLLAVQHANAWVKLENAVGSEWLPHVFDALWVANLDWEKIRSRRSLVKNKAEQIVSTSEKLIGLLDEFHSLIAHAGGGPSVTQWIHDEHGESLCVEYPERIQLRSTLLELIKNARLYDETQQSAESYVNAVLTLRQKGREYLRALAELLAKMGFPLRDKGMPPDALIGLADAAAGGNGAVDYKAFYDVFVLARKKSLE